MAEHDVTIVLKAKDQASAAVRNLRGEFDKFRKGGGIGKSLMGGLGMGVGLGAFSAVSKGLDIAADAVAGIAQGMMAAGSAGGEEDAEIARLNNTLDKNVHGWRVYGDVLDQAISKGEDLAFSDSELRDSIGTLTLRTHSLQKAFELQRGAMNIARAR